MPRPSTLSIRLNDAAGAQHAQADVDNAARLERARALHNADKRRLLEAHGRLVPSRAKAADMVQWLEELGCDVPTSDGMDAHMQALRAEQRRGDDAKIASGAPSLLERQLVPVMPSLSVPWCQ